MKSKNRCNLAGVILLYAVGGIYTFVLAVANDKSALSLLLIALGLVVSYAISAVFHETGHILLAKAFGFKVVGFSMGFVKFDLTYKRKVSFGRSDYVGETDIVPIKNGEFSSRYKWVIAGGIAGGFIASSILTSLYFVFSFNKLIATLFVSFPIVMAWFLINAVPNLIEDSDGSALYALSDEKNSSAFEKYLGILYYLYLGKTFSEIDEENFDCLSENSMLYEEFLVVNLMRAEEMGDGEKIREMVSMIKAVNNRLIETDKELIVAYSLLGERKEVENLKWALRFCDGDDLRSIKTRIAFSSAIGDGYQDIAKPTAKKIAEKWYLKGEGRFTEKLLEKF